MENMGLIAVAAAAGTQFAVTGLLLHVVAHGVGKTVLFVSGGQLQAAHGSTSLADISGVLGRSRMAGSAFAVGILVLLGMPPFAMFASELAIARSLADADLAWALAAAMVLVGVAFAALARHSGRILLGPPDSGAPPIAAPATVAVALTAGVACCAALAVAPHVVTDLLVTAGTFGTAP